MANALPASIAMDNEKATRGLVYTMGLESALPGLRGAFEEVDRVQNADRETYLKDVFGSVFSFRHHLGKVTCMGLWGEGADSSRVTVTLPPFTDCSPNVGGQRLAEYSQKDSANILDVIMASPNSARQTLKAAHHYELEKALGAGRTVLAFFSDTPLRTYSLSERGTIASGDFSPVAGIVEHGLRELQDRMHGPTSETQLKDIDIAGASQGATQAIAIASKWATAQDKYHPRSVTYQELVKADGILDLAKRFKPGHVVGEKSDYRPGRNDIVIPENELLRRIDLHGNEPAMSARILKAMFLKPANMRGLSTFDETLRAMHNLADHSVPQTAIQAKNSPMSDEATKTIRAYYLSREIALVEVIAVQDQYADHLANENVNVVSTGLALGIRR